MKKLIILALAALAPMPATIAGPVPTAVFQDATDEAEEPKKDPHLVEWPTLSKDQKKAQKKALAQLRKGSTQAMADLGRDGLLQLGDANGPALIKALSKERSEDARERITDVLDAVTGKLHTRLLAAEFTSKSEHVRTYCLERASGFPDLGIRSAAEKAFAAAQGRAGGKKEIKNELYFASLALASSGSYDSLVELSNRAQAKWAKSKTAIRSAIEALRSEKATAIIVGQIKTGDRKSTVAGLRMLAGCGDPETAKTFVAPMLDSTDNSIRVAAINALRGIVDNEKPVDRLSVFEAVERANKWKARLK